MALGDAQGWATRDALGGKLQERFADPRLEVVCDSAENLRDHLGEERADVPTAVFSQPPVATVGFTEAQARAEYDVVVFKSEFRALKHTISGRNERTFMKLVVERAGQRVVGAHMIGADAGEVIQGVAIAVKLGATKQQFDQTIGIHPTAAEEFVTLREPSK